MDSKDSKIIDLEKKRGEYKMNKNEKYNEKLKRGYKILAVTAVGAGLYGFKLGRKTGYELGVKEGYTRASNEFIEVMKGLTDEIRQSREE